MPSTAPNPFPGQGNHPPESYVHHPSFIIKTCYWIVYIVNSTYIICTIRIYIYAYIDFRVTRSTYRTFPMPQKAPLWPPLANSCHSRVICILTSIILCLFCLFINIVQKVHFYGIYSFYLASFTYHYVCAIHPCFYVYQ